jgi:hypothetical protein
MERLCFPISVKIFTIKVQIMITDSQSVSSDIGLPFDFIRPVGSGHLAFGNVGSVAGFE